MHGGSGCARLEVAAGILSTKVQTTRACGARVKFAAIASEPAAHTAGAAQTDISAKVRGQQDGISVHPTPFLSQVCTVISRHVLRRDVFAVAMILCLSIAHAADNNA